MQGVTCIAYQTRLGMFSGIMWHLSQPCPSRAIPNQRDSHGHLGDQGCLGILQVDSKMFRETPFVSRHICQGGVGCTGSLTEGLGYINLDSEQVPQLL